MEKEKKRTVFRVGIGVILFAILAVLLWNVFFVQPHKEKRVIFISKVIDKKSDFWNELTNGVKMAAEDAGIKLEIVGADVESDYERQNELMAWALEQKPDAVLLIPSGYSENSEMAKKLVDAGIILVSADSELEGNLEVCAVSTDNVEAGRKQGAYVKRLLKKDSQIAIIAHEKNASTAVDRITGVKKGLGADAERIVSILYSGSSYEKAKLETEALLASNPEIDIIIGLNEYTTVGAYEGILSSGKKGEIMVVGFDSSLSEVKMLEAGNMEATVIQKPFSMGYLSMNAIADILDGKPVEAQMDSGSELVTKDNMYTLENQKLLFPFTQ